MTDGDGTLVRRVAAGERAAIEEFVRAHTDPVWRFARSLVGDDGTAEELTQDTLADAVRGAGSFRAESSVQTWVLAICRRKCAGHHRRGRLRVVPLEAAGAHHLASETDATTVPALADALDQLPDDQREAFVLVSVLGHSRVDAAAVVGVPASTMRSRHDAARRALADLLAEEER